MLYKNKHKTSLINEAYKLYIQLLPHISKKKVSWEIERSIFLRKNNVINFSWMVQT